VPVPVNALRGGTYVPTANGLRFESARVVTDALASGTQTNGRYGTLTRLRLSGPAVARAVLRLRSAGRTTRITGRVGSHRVALRVRTS
jgi:hypothetical protein